MEIMLIDNNQEFLNRLQQDLYIYFAHYYKDVNFNLYSSHFGSIDFEKVYNYIFIDIDLDEKYNGIDLARKIREVNTQANIVFISAHSELMHDSMSIQPLYFIRKNTYEEDLLKFLMIELRHMENKDIIRSQFRGDINPIYIKDIICIEILCRNATIICKDAKYPDNRTLREILEVLPEENFIQVHKSYAINIDYIAAYSSKKLTLVNDLEINIGRAYRDNFHKKLKEYIIK